MKNNRLSTYEWVERIILALLFVGVGGIMITVFKPWGKQMIADPVQNYLWRLGVSFILLVFALLARRSKRFEKFWQLLFAMFILSTALMLDWVFGQFLYKALHLSDAEPMGWMYEKLHEVVLIVCVIIVFNKLAGNSLGSIYIQKGNLKLGLLIGGIVFLVSVVGSIPTAELLFNGRDLTVARVIPWVPIILIIVLANGTLEELLFRGLFLRKLEPFFGKFFSNLLIALVFTVLHKGSSYTSNEYIFLVILTPLALVLGWVMQKTDSIWGSILIHAGIDIPVFLGIFSNL